jgi:hypothetical protein
MQIGIITVDGRQVGIVSLTEGSSPDIFTPNIDGYEPEGRASEGTLERSTVPGAHSGSASRHLASPPVSHGNAAHLSDRAHHHASRGGYAPKGENYSATGGRPVHHGSAEVDQAIVDASRAHHFDPNFMRSVASIESSMNPSSNANRSTQYKGLFQIGSRDRPGHRSEWTRFSRPGDNIYSAHDNAMAAARMFDENRSQFRNRYGRDPTDTELYMMHQQGLGFYTRGAMTNIKGNPYPGMHGAQSHESFEGGWGREVARRKAAFAAKEPKPQAKAGPMTEENAP